MVPKNLTVDPWRSIDPLLGTTALGIKQKQQKAIWELLNNGTEFMLH